MAIGEYIRGNLYYSIIEELLQLLHSFWEIVQFMEFKKATYCDAFQLRIRVYCIHFLHLPCYMVETITKGSSLAWSKKMLQRL